VFGKKSAIDRIKEEKLYEIVADEIRTGQMRDGLWAKAVADTAGNLDQAKATYINLRVQSLKDEDEIAKQHEIELAEKLKRSSDEQKLRNKTEAKALEQARKRKEREKKKRAEEVAKAEAKKKETERRDWIRARAERLNIKLFEEMPGVWIIPVPGSTSVRYSDDDIEDLLVKSDLE
jgi:septal ring factor EnvC (AmiA/AmiB activator)